MPAELYLDCPTCAGQRLFEQPPCADGHGADCPELACVECGTAALLGAAPEPVAAAAAVERHAA